jgi:molybdate transport system ATP-binding protein
MLYVTHSAAEAARLADTLVVMDQGSIVAAGPVAATLAGAAVPIVLGEDAGALLEGAVEERDEPWQLARIGFAGGSLWIRDSGLAPGRRVRVRVLARDVSVATVKPAGTSIQNLLPCTVLAMQPDTHPSQLLVRMACAGDDGSILLARITARAANALELAPGKPVWAQVKSAALVE